MGAKPERVSHVSALQIVALPVLSRSGSVVTRSGMAHGAVTAVSCDPVIMIIHSLIQSVSQRLRLSYKTFQNVLECRLAMA